MGATCEFESRFVMVHREQAWNVPLPHSSPFPCNAAHRGEPATSAPASRGAGTRPEAATAEATSRRDGGAIVAPMDDLLLLIVSSPSGAGKTTLTRHLLQQFPRLTFSISHTTRPPRPGERNGQDYHFVERAVFERMRREGRFAEWAVVHGNLYGTSRDELDRARDEGCMGIVFDVDYQGARQLRASFPDAVGVFILPPSVEELHRRLVHRGSDSAEVIERRYRKARQEIEHYPFFDYLVVNEDLDHARAEICGIVHAELSRRWRRASFAEGLLREEAARTVS